MAKNKKSNKNGSASGKNDADAPVLPLFYQQPMPLDAKKHASLSMKKNFGFAFTEHVNAVPINAVEMPQVANYYPIAFSSDDQATPVAILGLRDRENLFIDAEGMWDPNCYIPAYIRRYPFIFSEIPNTDKLALCIDNSDEIIEESDAQPFFDKKGEMSALSTNALEFCKSYHSATQKTLEFSKALVEHDLLVQREAKINIGENRRINFSGFNIVDEEKFNALDDKVFVEWRKKGWLPIVYAHLFSGMQWQRLSRLLNERLEKEAA